MGMLGYCYLRRFFFMRTTDKVLRDWVYQNCELDLLALLPERTFFNTPKRVVVAHLKKRPVQLSPEALKKKLEKENVLLFAVSEIGESRDARRLPIAENDLEDLITAYKLHSVGAPIDPNVRRAVITQSINLYQSKSINIRHYWDKSVAQELGLLTEDEDPVTAKKSLDRKMESLESLIVKWQKEQASYPLPKTVKKFKKVKLGQEEIF
ncbi:hypothetical protein BJI55_06685 [Acinetobacter pittii]|nr:hypothetical protein BJI55_06685 [Acinetobacter pittii]